MSIRRAPWALRRREASFVAAASEKGIAVDVITEDLKSLDDPSLPDCIKSIVERVSLLKPRPTAYFIPEDRQMSLLHMRLMQKRLIRVGETALISCNNEQPYINGLIPRPATIDIQFDMIGHFGVQTLFWRLENSCGNTRVVSSIEPRLVVPSEEKNS